MLCLFMQHFSMCIFPRYFEDIIFNGCPVVIPTPRAILTTLACIWNTATQNWECIWNREVLTDPWGHCTKNFSLINPVISHRLLFCGSVFYVSILGPGWVNFYSCSNPNVTWSVHNDNGAYISPLEDTPSFYSESDDNSSLSRRLV